MFHHFSPFVTVFLLVLSVICMLAYRRLCLIIYCATCCPINLAGMWANSLKADDYQGTKNISFVWYLEPYYFFIPTKKWETMGVFDLRNGMVHLLLTHFFVWFVEWNELISHCIAHKLIISINMRCHPTKIHGMDSWCSTILDEVIPQTKHPRHGEGYWKFAACSFCTHGSRL